MADPYGPHQMKPPVREEPTVGLHHHFDRRFDDLEKRMDGRFDASERATTTALAAAEKATTTAMEAAEKAVLKAEALATTRSEQQNEWRQTVTDLIGTTMSRAEYAAAHAAIAEKIESLTDRVNRSEGREKGTGNMLAWMFAGLGGLVAVISLLIDFTH